MKKGSYSKIREREAHVIATVDQMLIYSIETKFLVVGKLLVFELVKEDEGITLSKFFMEKH